jgi:hypothetical protein
LDSAARIFSMSRENPSRKRVLPEVDWGGLARDINARMSKPDRSPKREPRRDDRAADSGCRVET